MTRFMWLALALFCLSTTAYAGGKKKTRPTETVVTQAGDREINWMSLEEVQLAMKKVPKKVWIDVYTDWCGWCKVMDKKTYSNPNVIQYLNEHFYAIKLNAEQKDSISFLGKKFDANQFAAGLMQGRMSYPTSIFMTENFQNPSPIPGYQDIPNMEMFLKYFAQELYKKVPFDRYQKEFKASWQ